MGRKLNKKELEGIKRVRKSRAIERRERGRGEKRCRSVRVESRVEKIGGGKGEEGE